MIETSYGKWIGGEDHFGAAALAAAKSVTPTVTFESEKTEVAGLKRKKMVRGGGFEPPRSFEH
jgi:hypothetical protein